MRGIGIIFFKVIFSRQKLNFNSYVAHSIILWKCILWNCIFSYAFHTHLNLIMCFMFANQEYKTFKLIHWLLSVLASLPLLLNLYFTSYPLLVHILPVVLKTKAYPVLRNFALFCHSWTSKVGMVAHEWQCTHWLIALRSCPQLWSLIILRGHMAGCGGTCASTAWGK